MKEIIWGDVADSPCPVLLVDVCRTQSWVLALNVTRPLKSQLLLVSLTECKILRKKKNYSEIFLESNEKLHMIGPQ
jgi:hypothetical protein